MPAGRSPRCSPSCGSWYGKRCSHAGPSAAHHRAHRTGGGPGGGRPPAGARRGARRAAGAGMGSVVAMPVHRPRIIELIGPAGAGKSAVAEELARMPGVLCTSIWRVPLAELAWATVCTIPSGAMLMRRARAPLSRELRHVARLRALLNFLDRDALSAFTHVVLDEGAIYTLAWLQVIGHHVFSDQRA